MRVVAHRRTITTGRSISSIGRIILVAVVVVTVIIVVVIIIIVILLPLLYLILTHTFFLDSHGGGQGIHTGTDVFTRWGSEIYQNNFRPEALWEYEAENY